MKIETIMQHIQWFITFMTFLGLMWNGLGKMERQIERLEQIYQKVHEIKANQ